MSHIILLSYSSMNKLTELLHSPYPVLYQRWKAVVIPAVIIFLILYLLQPFGIAQIEGNKLGIAFGSSLISVVASCICTYLLPALFPSFYKEQNWTLGRYVLNLLLLLFLIAIGLWIYQSWQWNMWLEWRLLLLTLFWVAVLAPFPTIFLSMWNRNIQLTRNLREATEMNFLLSKKTSICTEANTRKEEETPSAVLTFCGGTKEMLEVAAGSFLYAEAEGNYVKVNYRSAGGGKVMQKLLRATMKQAEEAVSACPFIIRCHRAFLVNIRQVVKVDGNSQGYRLRLEGSEEEVPVSRVYAKEVKTLIESKAEG